MQEIHLEGRQRIKSQEMAFYRPVCGFDRSRSLYEDRYSGSAISHAFYAAVLFCASGRLCAGGQTGSCLCVRLPGSGIGGDSRICSRRRAGVSDPSYLLAFLIGFVAAAWITGKLCWKRPGGMGWPGGIFLPFWGMMAYYLCGMV